MTETEVSQCQVLCRSCDLVVQKRALPSRVRALCPRCHTALYDTPYCSINGMLALCIAAILLFLPANTLSVIEIHFFGSIRNTTAMHAAIAVAQEGYWIVGLAVAISAVIAPLLLISSIFIQVCIAKLGLQNPFWRQIYTLLLKRQELLSQLTMLEIYVLSFLVSAFQLSDFSDVHMGMGTFCFTMLFIVMIFLQREYNLEHMWSLLDD
ncbi:paraquat-inducible protein A [Shewanella intestini]|uniref:Paraquat-inducible protein A n=1 Tax=Shewanella intestini TaxID=2017544 RepID=A0ABS5I1E0_9GAMM|nr:MULTISPECIES: paraquat-inducible protein A [Shewanella]MBR9727849.1 paraquat-inducible protein A [Shewanella intestini]MRG36158.1 paraquat-inducible protein A [Shewanella sp. XMDDZSB0408]